MVTTAERERKITVGGIMILLQAEQRTVIE
jgi:hypothetical protein